MEEKIKDAEYAVSNLKTLSQSIMAYTSYASSVCGTIDNCSDLFVETIRAQKAVGRLVKYINARIKKAKEQL